KTLIDRQGIIGNIEKHGDMFYFSGMRDMGISEIYSFNGKEEKKLTSFNDELMAERAVCPVEEFTFYHKDIELDGYVIKPLDYDPNKSYPGLLTIHGGPRAVFGPVYFHEMQMFANMGYFVFFTNPVGSDGRGNAFADLSGRHGSIDFDQCMALTDEVLKMYPQIDTKRVGVMGGSYGGFLTNWIVGNTDRFAAACSQRSISNWVSKCMTTDIGYYFNMDQIKADPWNTPDKMWTHSPLKYANKAKTPTLFIQADEDYRCWMGDAIQMFSALKFFGTETRMCLFHGENHELSRSGKPTHRVRRLTEMVNWFEKYLK
ncbi:MAG: S9 family peptidase, partial [Lachnospiraceae bacterium]|nr:S9 family peptidase [Lachnospiraceae bacterium]